MREVIPFTERVCDLCNDLLSDEKRQVVKSFVLTDWGAICFECWDNEVKHHEEFDIIKSYAKSQVIEDGWATTPMIIDFPDETMGESFLPFTDEPKTRKIER